MSLADKSTTRGGRLNTTTTTTRLALNRSTVSSVCPGIDRRTTTASALNSRTDKENRLNREKSSVGPGFTREKSPVSRGGVHLGVGSAPPGISREGWRIWSPSSARLWLVFPTSRMRRGTSRPITRSKRRWSHKHTRRSLTSDSN